MAGRYPKLTRNAVIDEVRDRVAAGASSADIIRDVSRWRKIPLATVKRWVSAAPSPDPAHKPTTHRVAMAQTPASSWWTRNRDLVVTQIIAGLVAGVVVTGGGLLISQKFSSDIASSQQAVQLREEAAATILENTRFVREVSLQAGATRPFMDLDLRGASLGLEFRCAEPQDYTPALRACLDFSRSDLSGGNITGADLTEGTLTGTKFENTLMFATTLDRVLALGANFKGAELEKSSLTQADFDGANFSNAKLHTTDLRGSTFRCFLDKCADLSHADLSASDLRGVDLSGARLAGANLKDTCFDATTKWPKDRTGVEIPTLPNVRYCLKDALPTQKPWYDRSASDALSTH